MDIEPHRELRVLEAIAADDRTTQRSLASKLGIALGLTNLYLKRLVRKGYIKCVNIQRNRIRYLITPMGIAEKTRLTYEFMDYSFRVIRESRKHLVTLLAPYTQSGMRIAIYGTGEEAEYAYLCLRSLNLEPVVIFDACEAGKFLGIPLLNIRDYASVAFDLMIVTSGPDQNPLSSIGEYGVPAPKLLPLRPASQACAAGRNVATQGERQGTRARA